MLDRLDRHRAERRCGTVGPEPVERIVVEKDDTAADRGKRLFEPANFRRGVQPRIDAEAEALGSMALQPDMRRFADEIAAGEDAAVHLLLELGYITAVDEDDRFALGHERYPGRTGKARQPRQPLGTAGHIFPLKFVGTRHEEAIDAQGCEGGTQGGGSLLAELGRGGDFEGLEHGLSR